MPITFRPGSPTPPPGSNAYRQAQSGYGTDATYDPTTGALNYTLQAPPGSTPPTPSTPAPAKAPTPAPQTPTTQSAPLASPTGSESGNAKSYLLSGNPDIASLTGNSASDAERYLTSGGLDPNFENQLFDKYAKEAAPSIAATEDAFNAEIKQTEDAANAGSGAIIGELIASGISGQAGAYLGKDLTLTGDQVNTLIAQRGQAVQTILDNVRKDAETNAPTLAQTATDTIKTLSSNFISWQGFQKQFPDEYNSIVDALGGENAAAALYTIQAPQETVIQSYNQGSHFVQVTKDPMTGAISSSSFDLGFTPPPNWTFQKVGTQGLLAFDPTKFNPSDPSTFKYYDATNGYQGQIQGLNVASKEMSIQRQSQLLESSKALEASRIVGSQVKSDKAIQNYLSIAPIMSRINASLSQMNSGNFNEANAADLLDAVTQLNTGGKAITEGQISLIKDSQSYADQATAIANKLSGSGGIVDKKVASDIATLSKGIYSLYQKAYQDHVSIYNDRLKNVNGQDLSSYSPLTDITQLPSYVSGDYDKSLQAAQGAGGGASGDTGAVPASVDTSLTQQGFTKNTDGSYSYGGTNYTYDATSGMLIDDSGNEVDPTQ